MKLMSRKAMPTSVPTNMSIANDPKIVPKGISHSIFVSGGVQRTHKLRFSRNKFTG